MTPIQWVAKELSIELRAAAIARKPLYQIAEEMGIGATALSSYVIGKHKAPDHVYRYCERAFQLSFDYLLTAIRCKKAKRNSNRED